MHAWQRHNSRGEGRGLRCSVLGMMGRSGLCMCALRRSDAGQGAQHLHKKFGVV